MVGGGAKSMFWNQIKSDVLQLPYVRLNRTEAAALGSAILAGYGVGVFDDLGAAVQRFTQPETRVTPDPQRGEAYRLRREFYEQLVGGEDALWRSLAALSAGGGRST